MSSTLDKQRGHVTAGSRSGRTLRRAAFSSRFPQCRQPRAQRLPALKRSAAQSRPHGWKRGRHERRALYRTPRSAWLKASAAAVRSYDPIRADIWLWYADLAVDRRAASGQDRHSTNGLRRKPTSGEALLLAAGLAAEQIDQVWDRYVLNRRNDHETSQTTRTDCTLDRPA